MAILNTKSKYYDGLDNDLLKMYYNQVSFVNHVIDFSLFSTDIHKSPYITIYHRDKKRTGDRFDCIWIYLDGRLKFKNEQVARLYTNHMSCDERNIYDILSQITKLVALAYQAIKENDASKFLYVSKSIEFILQHSIDICDFWTVDMHTDSECIKRPPINPDEEYNVDVYSEKGVFEVGYMNNPNATSRIKISHNGNPNTFGDFEIYDNGVILFYEKELRFSLDPEKDEIFETIVKIRRLLVDYNGPATDLEDYVKTMVPKKRKLLV